MFSDLTAPSFLCRRGLKATAVLMPLLGTSWAFAFLAFDERLVAFHYVSTVVNSLQVSGLVVIN